MTTGAREGVHGASALPAALLEAADQRFLTLAATASGSVFEVPEQRSEDAVRAGLVQGARYDTILSFMRTPWIVDLGGFVVALEGLLADDGWILMVEPAGTMPASRRLTPSRLRGRLDRRGLDVGDQRLQRLTPSRLRVWPDRRGLGVGNQRLQRLIPSRFRSDTPAGVRLDRDVVSTLRCGGFMVTDLHRCEVPSTSRPWRRFVELQARRESPWGLDGASTRSSDS